MGLEGGRIMQNTDFEEPTEEKTKILCKNTLRMDVLGEIATATHVQAKYQECDNANIEIDEEGNIVISHGGNTKRGEIQNNDFIEIDYKVMEMIELI